MVKNIILLLLLGICISSSAQKYKLVTTQWSKGKSAGNDYIKLLVDGTNHCSENGTGDSVANLGRTVVFDSNLDSLYIHGTDTSWGLGSGKFRFPDSPIWDSVSYGTQILIYNDKNKNPVLNLPDVYSVDATHFFKIPLSALERADTSSIPSRDTSVASPAALGYASKEGYVAVLQNPYAADFTTQVSDWSVIGQKGNEIPYENADAIDSWIPTLLKPATSVFNISISVTPQVSTYLEHDTINGVDTLILKTAPECPKNIHFTYNGSTLQPKDVSYKWTVDGVDVDSNYVLSDGDTGLYYGSKLTVLMEHNTRVKLSAYTSLICITNHVKQQTFIYNRPSIGSIPPPISTWISADSSKPIFDTLGRDTAGKPDSTKFYMGFCKGSTTTFTAKPDTSSGSDQYIWLRKNVALNTFDTLSYNNVYTENVQKDEVLLFTIINNLPCVVSPDDRDTVTVFVKALDSIAIPKITITGDTGICSGIKDTFTATLTPNQIGDTTAKYKIVWLINNTASTTTYEDTTIYIDGDTRQKIYVDSTTQPGDNISAILLVAKNNSCAYYDSTLSYSLISPDSTVYQPLHNISGTLTLGITQTITPTISLTPSQNYLCPDSILQRLGVKDTVLFTAVADTISAKTARYTWFINGVPVTDSSLLTFSANNDTTTFISKGLLKDGDSVRVIMVTSFKCVTSDSATNVIQMNPGIPVFTANLAAGPFCSAGLQSNVILSPDGVQNQGAHPTYQWTLNNTFVTDSSAYVYSPIRDKDTVGLVITSSIACAQPKSIPLTLPIVVTTALTPRDSISATTLTTCSNDPSYPNGSPFVINTYPTNGGDNPTYACYLVGASGPGSDVLLANDTIVYLTNTGTTPQIQQVYCVLTSSESCVTTPTAMSVDTLSITVEPLPVVAPILGNSSVCVGATTTLTETTTGGTWNSLTPFNLSVDTTGKVMGLNQGAGSVLYRVEQDYGTLSCFGSQNFSITVNPSDVPFDSLYYKTICAGQSDTISNSIVPQGTFYSSDPTIATITTGQDINGNPIAIVTPVGNGRVIITDSIVNDCGTTLRYDTIFVGAPTVAPIQGDNTICTIGGTSQLSVVVSGDTARLWSSSDPTIVSVDPVTGLATAVGSGSATITLNAYNACAQFSPVTQSYTINVGRPNTTASISGGTSPICTASSSQPFNSSIYGGYWVSSDTTIATIDSLSGIATGKALGNTTLYYVVYNTCGKDSAAQQSLQVIQGVPIQHSVGDSVVCNRAQFQYSNPSTGALNTSWSVTNTNLANIDPSSGLLTALNQGGLDTIIYAYTNGCGTKYDSITVVIGAPVIQQLIAKSPICVNDTITLASITRGATLGIIWNSLNENYLHIINNQTGLAVGVGGGLAKIQYVATNACSISLASNSVAVNALPVIPAIVGRPSLCVKDTLTYTDTTLNGVWSSSNATAASIGSTGFVTALTSGQTTLKYAVTSAATSCSNAVTETVTVNPLPTLAAITGATNVCAGRSVTLANTTTTPTSSWTSNNTAIATVTSTGAVLGLQPGSTTIKYLVVDANSCRDSVSAPITVNAIPQIAPIVGLPNLCTGKTWQFTDATAGGTWSTDFGKATITATGNVTSVTKGDDTIRYKVVTNGCDTAVSFHIGLTTPAVAPIIAAKTEVAVGLTIDLNDDSLPGVWSSLQPGIATVEGVSSGLGRVTGIAPGSDSIQYTYTDPTGCEAPAYILITVLPQLNDVYIPTAFSPTSSDAANRNFMVLGKDIASLDFKVFSPWGELLFQTSDKNAVGWDGTKGGKFEPSGVYVYTAKITLLSGKTINKKGAVNLIR